MRYEVIPEVIGDRRRKANQFAIVEVATDRVIARYANKDTAEELVYRLNEAGEDNDD